MPYNALFVCAGYGGVSFSRYKYLQRFGGTGTRPEAWPEEIRTILLYSAVVDNYW